MGYPGWDKVDALAHALLSLKGLSVKASQVESIKRLYDNLTEFDKRPLQFSPLVKASRLRGRFARSRSQSGHISIDCVKRYVHVYYNGSTYIVYVHRMYTSTPTYT